MPFVNPKYIRVFVIIISVFFSTVGCGSTSPTYNARQDNFKSTTTPIIITPVVSEPDPLDGTQWKLISIVDREKIITISKDTQPLVQFNKGGLGFYVGCNDINGYYELDNHDITITFSERTVMDCTDRLGVEIMEVEELFYQAMQTFESYSVKDDQLRIYYADGEMLFRHSPN